MSTLRRSTTGLAFASLLAAPVALAQPASPTATTSDPTIRVVTAAPTAPVRPTTIRLEDYASSDDGLGLQHNGITPELHTVRTGDTLWDISWYYFNDPWQWPKVWSYNAQISNPHWIYPGDLVRLLPKGQYVATVDEPDGESTIGTPTLAGPTRKSSVALRDVAFVDREDLDLATSVDGSPEEKQLLATGDSVYLAYPKERPPRVGSRYSIYKEKRAVSRDGKDVGAYVEILGELEVVSVKEGKRARGVIIDARREIERGNKVGPLVTDVTTLPAVAPKVDAQGTIIAMLTKDQLIGEGEIVFINLGADSGLVPGNRMRVVRRGDAAPTKGDIQKTGQDDRRYEARALGEIEIIDVGKNQSMGLISLSIREMGVGDLVMMQKADSPAE